MVDESKQNTLISVAVLEDDPLLRESVGAMLRGTPGFGVPMLYEDTATAMRKMFRLPPRVVLVDLKLPGDSGLRFLRLIRNRLPKSVLIVLTAAEQEEYILAALGAGADGYLLKTNSMVEIVSSIRRAAEGEPVFSSPVLRKLLNEFRRRVQRPTEKLELSENEQRLLDLTDAGWSCQAIAQELGLSVHTVYAMNKALYPRLRVNSRAAAAAVWRQMQVGRSSPQPASSATSR